MSAVLFDLLTRQAALAPDRVALEYEPTGALITYQDLETRAARAATLFQRCGARPGDRVALLCRNRPEFFEVLFACAKLGAILVPLNWRMPSPELKSLVEDCAPVIMLHGAEDERRALQSAKGPVRMIALDDEGASGYQALRDDCPVHAGRQTWSLEDIWYLLYTSGTTGQPKAVIQTYGMALFNYINARHAIDISKNDVTANFLPMFHTAGINLFSMPTLLAGGRVIVMPGFDDGVIMRLLQQERLSTFFAVPTVYQALSQHVDFEHVNLSAVRSWNSGGAPLSDDLVERFARRGARLCNGYGMTETGPVCLIMDPENVATRIGSVGRPQFQVGARVVDRDGQDVATGEQGEIWVSGPAVTPGYWQRPEETASSFAPGGWLKTGDIGYLDAAGYFYVSGRVTEMFICGGENVFPAEVERVLAAHPGVEEAAVIGITDSYWGEVGKAFVILRPNVTLEAEDLRTYCKERLAAPKVPKFFVFMETDFPRTASGKVQKHLLPAGPDGA